MKIGVVALRIEAMPLLMRVSPQAISTNGMTLLSRPSSRKRAQSLGLRGIAVPCANSHRFIATAAIPTRPSTTVTGGNTATRIL